MTSGVPWQVQGVRREAIDTAREAARRSGVSVAEWLDTVIAESARDAGVESRRPQHSDFDDTLEAEGRLPDQSTNYGQRPRTETSLIDVNARLDVLSGQIDDLISLHARQRASRQDNQADDTARVITDALSRLHQKIDRLASEGRSANSEIERRVTAIDRTVARFDWDLAGANAPSTEPMSPLDQALAEIEARQFDLDGGDLASGLNLSRAPTQRLPDLEHRLRQINDRIDTMGSCGLNNAVETLRDDLAEIGLMLKDAMPRQAIEALESEIRVLSDRIDSKRHAGADSDAVAGIEQGLAEVRDALHALTPAENLVAVDETVQGLSQRIDRITGSDQDPATLKQLEGAIVALRGVMTHVASDDALGQLSEEMRALSAKVDQVTASDAFATMEMRMASIAEALHLRAEAVAEPTSLEAAMRGLTDQIDRLNSTVPDPGPSEHLEERIVSLVEKLNASDARLGQLDTSTEELKRDVQRTHESLESVHGTLETVNGTLGHVVDRLATIETTIRTVTFPQTSLVTTRSTVGVSDPETTSAAAMVTRPAPESPRPPAIASAPAAIEAAPPLAPNPAPAPDRGPIDPNLPPDHPLEPGLTRARHGGSPTERIAASEADLEHLRPPVIPDPGGKSNFIAAARRAAQAAIIESPQPKDKRAATSSGAGTSIAGKISGRIRKLMVGASVVVLVLAVVHFMVTRMWPSGTITADSAPQITDEDRAPITTQSTGPTPGTALERQSSVPSFGLGLPPGSLTSLIGPQNGVPANINSDRDTTGSIPQQSTQNAAGAMTALNRSSERAGGADRLPAEIGGGGLRAAAARGDAAAQFEIASRYADGRGISQNLSEAAAWFERAASKGLAPAQFRLGGLYEKGMGVPKNTETARRLYLAAAEAGNARAMHNLAVLYAEGVEGKPDYQTAARWFRKAADHGVVDSQYNLGILYARGIGLDTNLAEAFKWFALASREGDGDAAKRRDELASRLDKPSLGTAMAAAQSWQALPQPEAAVQVMAPAGGWDGVRLPSTAKRTVSPKAVPATRHPAQ